MSRSCQPTGPICFHQSMNAGCHASSARCRRLSPERLTLFGILSSVSTVDISGPLPLELRPLGLAVQGECAVLSGRVRAREDPVLPGAEPAEDLGLERLGTDEAE